MGELRAPAAPRAPATRPPPAPPPHPPAPAAPGQALMRVAASLARASRPAPGARVGAADAPHERAAEGAADAALAPGAPTRAVDPSPLAFAGARPARALGADAGEPLGEADRAFFEPRLGRDLAGVRLHRGARAEQAAAKVGARAFALGPDVFLGRGADAATDDGRRVLAHELAHVAAGTEAEGPVLRRISLAAFRARLEATSPDHARVISALFANPRFVPLITFLGRCPAGALDFFVGHVTQVVGGRTVELFGGFSPASTPGGAGELSVNPFRPEHASNPLEMVDTIVHEAIHAIQDLAPQCASAANPNPLAGTGVADRFRDPELAPLMAAGFTDSRSDVLAASAAGVRTASGGDLMTYFQRNYGPSASRPETHFIDLNRQGLELVTSIIADIRSAVPGVGRQTVSFDNVEMFRAEALLASRPWLNASQFAYSKGLFKDQVATERKIDPATYTDREYQISAIQVVEFADTKSFDPNTAGGWGPIGGVWECFKRSRFTGRNLKTTVTGVAGSPPGGATGYRVVQHS